MKKKRISEEKILPVLLLRECDFVPFAPFTPSNMGTLLDVAGFSPGGLEGVSISSSSTDGRLEMGLGLVTDASVFWGDFVFGGGCTPNMKLLKLIPRAGADGLASLESLSEPDDLPSFGPESLVLVAAVASFGLTSFFSAFFDGTAAPNKPQEA